jgi:hypothetical protein
LHYDDYVNFMLVLMGKKVFIIGHPDMMGAGAGNGRHNEHLDWTPHALTFERRGWFLVTLYPGDGLLLPAGWWHYVITDENSLMANWWTEKDPVCDQTEASAHAGADADAGAHAGADNDDDADACSNSDSGGIARSGDRMLGYCHVPGTDIEVTSYRDNLTVVSAPASTVSEQDAFAAAFGWGNLDLFAGYERDEIHIAGATKIPKVERVWGAVMTSKKNGSFKQEQVIVKESRTEAEFQTERAVYSEFANTAAYCTTMVLGVRIHLSATSSRTNKKFYVVTLRKQGDLETQSVVRDAIVKKFNEESRWEYRDNKPRNFVRVGDTVFMLDFGDCERSES